MRVSKHAQACAQPPSPPPALALALVCAHRTFPFGGAGLPVLVYTSLQPSQPPAMTATLAHPASSSACAAWAAAPEPSASQTSTPVVLEGTSRAARAVNAAVSPPASNGTLCANRQPHTRPDVDVTLVRCCMSYSRAPRTSSQR